MFEKDYDYTRSVGNHLIISEEQKRRHKKWGSFPSVRLGLSYRSKPSVCGIRIMRKWISSRAARSISAGPIFLSASRNLKSENEDSRIKEGGPCRRREERRREIGGEVGVKDFFIHYDSQVI
jgi:hypothetical protein